MSPTRIVRTSLSIAVLSVAALLAGCAGVEFAPKGGMLWYHKELPAADRAVEAARAAGKAAQCPAAFNEAASLRDEAYKVYRACRTDEAIALANQATAKANALCPVARVAAPPVPAPAPPPPVPAPAPPPPPPPAPTAAISASPAAITAGQCTTLMWSSTNASSASVTPAIGGVDPTGSRQVCPPSTTEYTLQASGPGGSRTASTTVTVTPAPPPPPAPAPKVIERLTLRVNFDFDKAAIRPADVAELEKGVAFVKKYPGYKISIEGHTDSVGTEAYNQRLSERRAVAVKDYLVKQGAADGNRMTTVGYGESKPIADNKTPEGRFQNRRVEILILAE